MSLSQSHSEVQVDQDGSAHGPQQPRASAPSHHQAVSFATMPDATSANDTLEGPGLVTSANWPYTVRYAYPSPVMQSQTPFGMHAGTHAAQASHPQMPLYYQPAVNSSLQQVQHNVFSPNQSMLGMTATGFEPNNNNDCNHFIAPPMVLFASAQASFANDHGTSTNLYPEVPQPGDTEPSANTNGWTEAQDNLVRRLKHRGKKGPQIKVELEREFGVVRSTNAISKRWKTIKKRDSREPSRAVRQNVSSLSTLLRELQNALSRAVPEYESAQHDPQMAWLITEIQEDIQTGITKLVESCVLKLQRLLRRGEEDL